MNSNVCGTGTGGGGAAADDDDVKKPLAFSPINSDF